MTRKLLITAVLGCLGLGWMCMADGITPFQQKLTAEQQVAHALGRLTFGARLADAERVRKAGVEKWIEQQLNPEKIRVNPELQSRLAPLESLQMSDQEIVTSYPPPQYIRAISQGRLPPPDDPELAAVVRRLAERDRTRQMQDAEGTAMPGGLELRGMLAPEQWRQLRRGEPEEKVAVLTQMEPARLSDLLFALPQKMRRGMYAYSPVDLRRRMLLTLQPQQVVAADLVEGKLYRAIYSERQLQEVLTDFWFNHFNVYMDKGVVRQLVTSYERDAIRPHVLGRFGDMLLAVAQHPAMLFYLDNWQSADPEAVARIRKRRKDVLQRVSGLNENYARELLELHTLGADGGFSEDDVLAVARCFTGWSIEQPQRGGGFRFNQMLHDDGVKTVLGQRIPSGGGIEDGFEVLDILAAHPSTARFISTKLARRFVADHPPESLVNKMAQTFSDTEGDLREVMRTMLTSREFFSSGAYRSKVKSPLEMVASAVRALDADVTFAFGLSVQIEQMGQPLYRKEEPTGYANQSDGWLNAGTLVARLNFAQALATNKLPGTRVDASRFGETLEEVAAALLQTRLSESSRAVIETELGDSPVTPDVLAALVLGSPEFQRR
jgi:uncharacterized protein (DUF1800 family)